MPYPDDVPSLTDGRVTLRALHVDDALRVVEQCNDPESITWTTVPRPYGTAEAHDWITRVAPACWADGTDLVLAVEHAGVFAGSVALRPRGGGEAEVGFGLHPDARGQGVMRAALTLLLDWAFTEGYAVVHWRAQVGNWDSRRVAWTVGFTFGPTIPRLLDQRGERVDAWTGWIGSHDPRAPVAPWHEVPVLEAGDLRLRPWAEHDGDRLVETSRDPVLRAFLPDSPLPAEPDAVAAYLTRVHLSAANGARLGWCVADAATDRALAGVALFDLEGPDGAGAAQVGYWSHPEGRGRGVVTRGLERLAAYAFSPAPEGPGMRRLYLLTAASNAASRRVAERAGFEHVGTERRGATVADGFDDNLLYDRLAPQA